MVPFIRRMDCLSTLYTQYQLSYVLQYLLLTLDLHQYQIEASGQLDSKSEVVTFAIIVADIFMIFGLGLLIGLNRRHHPN